MSDPITGEATPVPFLETDWPKCWLRKDPLDPCGSSKALFSVNRADTREWRHLCPGHFWRWISADVRSPLPLWVVLEPTAISHEVALD